ncbi:transporter, CPA2 family [Aeromicrobium marinum DSM 15272]|uniref:Transporter, CPA2 family n=1 Tax=Aeromicrobium marinum DSM 15272 TaxID=585531 RepID=E2SAC0_9ACTN|nr:cation:proton antiporter [Aeromicrobium marinum]EFQ84194.1 transporter, CPA2 family [Aeromicrobium marinum DSM 15272]
MLDLLLLVVGLLGLVVAVLSRTLRRLPFSEPLVALGVGLLLGPSVTGALDVPSVVAEPGPLHEGARVLLAVSVMAVALRYPVSVLARRARPLVWLLLVAMPAMAVVSSVVSGWILGVWLGTAALIGAAICPTDPVLASSAVTGEPAERDLPAADREILSVESGANDGLALPLVLGAVAIAGPATAGAAAVESLRQVLGAVVIGAVIGWLGGHALRRGEQRGATAHGPALILTLVLALAILGAAGLTHTDGVLAVFVGGLVFNLVSSATERTSEVAIDEAVNRFVVLPLFVVLGASAPWQDWWDLGWRGPALVVAVLALRRVPVLLLLARPLGLPWRDALFVGWFGPVGVSAIFYLTLEAERLDLPPVVLAAGSLVVVASTVAHGLTASPGRALYRWSSR